MLEDKLPPVLPDIYLPEMKGKTEAFKPIEKLNTPEKLIKELALIKRIPRGFASGFNIFSPEFQGRCQSND